MQVSTQTRTLADYLSAAAHRPLSDSVMAKARLHLLDTLAAIISGAHMPAGIMGRDYVRRFGGHGRAHVIGTSLRTGAVDAALANGMSAHADETDDSHAMSLSHPGCAVVSAALAVAAGRSVSGDLLLRAVCAGYDVGTRIGMAIGHPESPLEGSSISTHAHVGVYAAAVASSVLMRLGEEGMRAMLALAGQSASGTTSWARDPHHIEKAFVFGGMPASNGVRAAQLAEGGLRGVPDPFAASPNVLDAYSPSPDRAQLTAELGTRFEIVRSTIKKLAVGSPSQAAVQAVLDLLDEEPVDPSAVDSVIVTIPHDLARVVDGRELPNINVQYLIAGTIVDGRFSFAMAHDRARMTEPAIRSLVSRTRLVYDRSVTAVRRATVVLVFDDGHSRQRTVTAVRGTPDNPMCEAEVVEKAHDLMDGLIGARAASRIVDSVSALGRGGGTDDLLDALRQFEFA
ncbi:MmgE/PrpD family protein [Microbacterium soli]|uniref:MmgE/PrpD family protein n=1 Tax=Microbacterium soli TaxID=446075 RepID=A0ABP7MSE3_9MICO